MIGRTGRLVCIATAVLGVGCETKSPPRPVLPERSPVVELGPHLPPLDQGRVRAAPPAGWHVPPRSRKFLARFSQSRSKSYPSILLTVADDEEFRDVTEENVDEFRNELEGQLLAEGGAADVAVEVVRAGSCVGAMYRKQARTTDNLKTITLDRTLFETVVGGRRYTVELRAEEGTTDSYRGHLLAVIGGLEFAARATAPPERDISARNTVESKALPSDKPAHDEEH